MDARIQDFLAGEDVILDREFLLFDIQASRAHAEGLQRIGILSADELSELQRELDSLADDFRTRRFVLDERFEDCHSAIEARLTERLGDAGRKIHTGRSRNDQILVATRLWLKDRLARVAETVPRIAKVALDRARSRGATCHARLHAPAARRGLVGGHVVGGAGPRLSSTTRFAPRQTLDWSMPIRWAAPPDTA